MTKKGRMKMNSFKLKEDFYWVGIQDHNLRVFDIIMETKYGTTYNSYLLKGSEKIALFETAKEKFFDEYLKKVEEVCPLKDIDYIIANHTEPDHAGSIGKLVELNPEITVVGTAMAVNFIKNILNKPFKFQIVKEGETLSLGNKTLKFMVVPNLHWPDTMYTYIEEDKTLVTCDSFGSHYSFDHILLSKVENKEGYEDATKYYYDNILGPFASFMLKAIAKVEAIDVDMICPGHGPVIDCGIKELIEIYKKWSTVVNPNTKKTVVMPYVSAYGYTKMLAEAISAGVKKAGDIDVKMYDMVESSKEEVLNEICFADGLLFGSPTILGEALKPILDITNCMFPITHGGKFASAFGSFGWSGEAVPHIIERLKQLRLKVTDEGFRVKFKPSDDELEEAEAFGENFGKKVLGID